MTSKRDWPVEPDTAGPEERLFFDAHEWALLDAVTARIIPTDHDPGAREARVVRFIDRYLSGTGYIYAAADGSGFLRPAGKEAEAWDRRIRASQSRYREGLRRVEEISRDGYGRGFLDLDEAEQDQVLVTLSGWPKPTAEDIRPVVLGHRDVPGAGGAPPSNQPIPDDQLEFFPMLVLHARQGFYADPVYGGNAGHLGWQVIGFPGPESLALTRDGRYTTVDYLLPDAQWPYSPGSERS